MACNVPVGHKDVVSLAEVTHFFQLENTLAVASEMAKLHPYAFNDWIAVKHWVDEPGAMINVRRNTVPLTRHATAKQSSCYWPGRHKAPSKHCVEAHVSGQPCEICRKTQVRCFSSASYTSLLAGICCLMHSIYIYIYIWLFSDSPSWKFWLFLRSWKTKEQSRGVRSPHKYSQAGLMLKCKSPKQMRSGKLSGASSKLRCRHQSRILPCESIQDSDKLLL